MNPDFVYIDDYGLLGTNFYWNNRKKVETITDEELFEADLRDNRVRVHKDIIDLLVEIDKKFQERGYRIYIKEGYRSKALYELVYKKRVELYGKEATDRILNMKDMPHASGKTVDVALWDPATDTEIYLRDKNDGDDGYFIHFYKDRVDEQGQAYQRLQDLLITTMQDHGFRLGTKREYFHFDYKPDIPRNY